MSCLWQLMPEIKDKAKKQDLGLSQPVLQLLCNRGLKSKEEIKEFLSPDYSKYSHDPFLFKNMEAAVDLIIKHIKTGSFIVVYGDFDADGVTSVALLFEVLSVLKARVNVYIPDRTREGYGLNKKAIEELSKMKNKLIITVDNGIRNKEEVQYGKNLGLDLIITDHHEAPMEKIDLPDCPVINPMIDSYPFKNLAGVGVAFKLAKALISKSKLLLDQQQKLQEKILDLVSVGTIADCVSLLGENRVLVREGLEVLNQQKRLGLSELIKVSQINLAGSKKINSWNVGWQIAPRINSAGRLGHANTAYELLITKDEDKARNIALNLNEKNSKRQKITDEIFNACKEIVDKEMESEKILILVSPNLVSGQTESSWSEGVIGLVAGRLSEQYFRPALVITESDSEIRGSGRSIEQFDIIWAIEQAKEFLTKFGGHTQACGFSLKDKASLSGFTDKMKKIANDKLADIDLKKKLIIDAELNLDEIDEKLVLDLEKFEPFGEDNTRPVFLTKNLEIRDIIKMGIDGQHLKLRLNNFWAVGFSQAEKWNNLRIGEKIDLVYLLELNEFNGRREVQMKIVDIKKADEEKNL